MSLAERSPGKGLPAWLLLLLLPLGLLLLIPAAWIFASVTAKPLHPDPERVPTVIRTPPSSKWAAAAERARKIATTGLVLQNLPGLSVAVGTGGELVWAEGFGYADLKTGQPVTPDHRFRIGTASTVLTSAAAGLLIEEGRWKPDDRIQTYVPTFPENPQSVTLRQLMGHTAGIVSDGGDEGPLFTRHCQHPAEALPAFVDRSPRFPPGTEYRYSIYGWILISAAMEAAAGKPFLTLMQERVFDPAGMHDTIADAERIPAGEDFPLINMFRELFYDPEAKPGGTKKPFDDRVTAYFPRFAADPKYGLHVMRPLDYSCYAGSSVFQSTPSDLVRFGMAMQGGRLLKPGTVQLLQTSQRLPSGEETGYGLGWYARTVRLASKPTRVVGHDGDLLGGRVASFLIVPDSGIVVAVVSNISYADTFSLALDIAESFGEQTPKASR